MNDTKKIAIGAVAAVAVGLAIFVVYKTVGNGSPSASDTQAGVTEQAGQMVKASDPAGAIPKAQYDKLMAGAQGGGKKAK